MINNPASFVNERLGGTGIYRATVGGPKFQTMITTSRGGFESRNVVWSLPLASFELGERKITQAELDDLNNFFRAAMGRGKGFRFKDWGDHRLSESESALVQEPSGRFALFKAYGLGGSVSGRRIYLPVLSTLKVYSNGVEQPYTFDGTDCTLSIPDLPPNPELTASCEFDIPVRFDTDDMKYRIEHIERATGEGLFYLYTLPLTEIRLK